MTPAGQLIEDGYRLRRERRLADALRAFEQAVAAARTAADEADLARALAGLGQIERDRHDRNAAFAPYDAQALSTLADGYHPVPAGKLATIVTSLEMFARPDGVPATGDPAWRFEHRSAPDLAWYRALYRRVGEPYLWASRLELSDTELQAILADPGVDVYRVGADGDEVGIVELDFRIAGECELTYFGVTHAWIGRGIGRWMMDRAIERAWSRPIARFWVHTCSLDHPAALPFYRRSGFVPFRSDVEIFTDPRTTGLYPPGCAGHIPLFPG